MENQRSPDGQFKYDVFLSHRSSDKEIVRDIAILLQDTYNISLFFDEWHLVPGEPLQERLELALQQSKSCIAFIGGGGMSPWENEEIRIIIESRIRNNSIRIIPVLLPGASEKSVEELPPLLRRFLWVDFRSGFDSGALSRLVAGIQGMPPGRNFSGTISDNSIFVKKSTRDLFQQFLPFDISQLQFSSSVPLDNVAKLIGLHYPKLDKTAIRYELSKARGAVYDAKYAPREKSDDERYINFQAWRNHFRQLLSDVGCRNLGRLDVINVGIGNGNENPDFYADFRSMIGVDTSEQSLARASKEMPFLRLICGEAENLSGVDSDSRDLYLSLRTYQSSYFNIYDAIIEAYRVLRRRGVVVISIPNVYVDKKIISKGLQKNASNVLDPHFSWEIAEKVRRALYDADFDSQITTGPYEIFIIGQK